VAPSPEPRPSERRPTSAADPLVSRHLRLGWWSIALGLVLEVLHGFKIGAYLDVSNETRRLMWTLAHAHGTLLGLAHVGFAWTASVTALAGRGAGQASSALTGATLLLPGGFLLAGVRFYAADPGIGIVLVPVGAALLIYAAVQTARGI
jgi:hypothetical protein